MDISFRSVTKEMTECVNKNVYNEKGAECSEVQIERLLQHFGPTLQRDLSLRYNPAQCKKGFYYSVGRNGIEIVQFAF